MFEAGGFVGYYLEAVLHCRPCFPYFLPIKSLIVVHVVRGVQPPRCEMIWLDEKCPKAGIDEFVLEDSTNLLQDKSFNLTNIL